MVDSVVENNIGYIEEGQDTDDANDGKEDNNNNIEVPHNYTLPDHFVFVTWEPF